ncbi:hypothetical protein K2Y11_23370 [bacterium]|nr:hypothetical protein [bacterium]
MNSLRLMAIVVLVTSSIGCRCFQHNPRRDVGRVQANVGSGQTEIFPRTNTQPYSPAVLAGPLNSPTNNIQGTTLAVAGPPPGTQVPMQGVVPAQPGIAAVPGVAAMPTPVYVAQPAPAMAIPVVFNTPATRSSFIPAGTPVPVAVAPAGVAVPNAGPGGIPAPQAGGFLGDQPPMGLQLMPALPQQGPAPVAAPAQVPAQRPAVAPTRPPVGGKSPLNPAPSDRPPITMPSPPKETSSPSSDTLLPNLPETESPKPPGKAPGSGPSRLSPPPAPPDLSAPALPDAGSDSLDPDKAKPPLPTSEDLK